MWVHRAPRREAACGDGGGADAELGRQLTEHVRSHFGTGKSEAKARAIELLRSVRIPEPGDVDRFLPPFDPGNIRFAASAPESQAVAVLGGGPYSYFRYQTHLAAQNALAAYDRIAGEFNSLFGRPRHALEAYRTEDAEIVFYIIGSFATKAREAVDRLREAGQKVGLLRPRLPAGHLLL